MSDGKQSLWCATCSGTGSLLMADPWGGVFGTCPDCHGNPWLGGDSPMNLGQFIAQTAFDVARFHRYWLASQRAVGKEQFPNEMPQGEWFEQFLMFLNTEAAL